MVATCMVDNDMTAAELRRRWAPIASTKLGTSFMRSQWS
jgi:hypothetical protein